MKVLVLNAGWGGHCRWVIFGRRINSSSAYLLRGDLTAPLADPTTLPVGNLNSPGQGI